MDTPNNSGLLSLFVRENPVEVGAALRSLIDQDPEFLHSGGVGATGPSVEFVFRAVALHAQIGTFESELSAYKPVFCNKDLSAIGGRITLSLGSHVAGGERVPPIVRNLLDAGLKLGTGLGAVAAVWHPAQIISGFDYFSQSTGDYLSGGAFPVLLMINFKAGSDGIDTVGLDALSGQELKFVGTGMDEQQMMQRLVRVAHDVAVNGPIKDVVTLDGIEPGERLTLNPLQGAKILKIIVS